MADFLSVIENISDAGTVKENGQCVQNGDERADDSDPEIDEKELEEQVSDLVEIRNREILRRNVRTIVRENLLLKAKLKKLEGKLKKDDENNDSYNLLFRIDIDGDEEEDQEIPVGQSQLILSNQIVEEEVVEEKKNSGSNKCFNCLGEHMITDCPQPKDQKAIAKNRREFQSRTATSVRYHVDERFSHLRPGLASDSLRSALRVRSDQLPEYIYRMRRLGYPPGWLKAAEINSSGLALYHEKGARLGNVGEEDGEIMEEQEKIQYSLEKLIEWPGFNSPVPEKFRDETGKYRAMSYSAVKSLKEMKRELRPKEEKGYVRGKMQDTSISQDSDDIEIIDLDSSQESVHNLDKKPEASLDSEIELKETEYCEVEGKESNIVGERESCNLSQSMSTPSRQTSISSSSGSIAKTEPGTPICEMYSPFSQLPGQISFNKDMSEHIVFENLPEYTGKWDQMRGLISRIRKRKIVNDEEKQD